MMQAAVANGDSHSLVGGELGDRFANLQFNANIEPPPAKLIRHEACLQKRSSMLKGGQARR